MHPTHRPRGHARSARSALLVVTLVAAVLPGAAAASSGPAPQDRPSRCTLPTDQEPASSQKHTIDSGDRERSFILRLPKGYDQRADWPLVVAFHGRGSTGAEVEGYSDLSSLPAVVAYPDGVADAEDGERFRKAWQGAPYEVDGVDDVAFTEDLLDHLQSTTCVDETRTYATGKSNGAGLAALLSCRLPDRFAAVGLVAAALYPGTQDGCADAPPVPLALVHGEGDATIPYDGDADRDLPAVRDWLTERAERDGCRTPGRTGRIGRDVTTVRWTGCDDGSELRHLAVADGGHVWPGAVTYSGGGHVTSTIRTHQQLWSFFRQHELTAGGPDVQEDPR
ncbi:alpha/beta hydrolase family esterase [Aeromicrobium sp. CF4.19]|uniref:alpha/beta hydrolase family esterase n=1 Tax=Aeromicrobium sp. CF4.19 TaxID=3373082 RepID=UPI003EE604C1